jgi:diguanylate cyclase (GGDEF)-like protein/PAS domain S-box-containing protein
MKPGARTSGTEHRQSPPPAAIRILVLEDNPADLELIRRALRDAKLGLFRVTAAGRLRQALDLLARAPFEAILADLHLPDSDGFETILQLRAHYPNVPLLVLTGVDDESIGVAAMQQGAQDFIFKGALGGQSLARSIRYAMERHRLETSLREANEGLEQAVQARTLALQEREAGLRRAQLMASLAHVITGPNGAFESWSESLPKLIGVEPAHVPASTREWLELVHPEDRADFRAAAVEADRTGTRLECEYRLRRADGAWMHIRQVSEPLDGTPDGSGELRWFGTLQDVTERKAAEERVRRLNRVYAMLSGINTLIVRVCAREELFREACRIAVDAGQFRLAWIGVVDRDAGRVQLVAWSGGDEEYIQSMPLGLGDPGAEGRGLAGLVVGERRAIISNDMAQDPRVLLKEEATARGFRSLAMLPLLISGKAAGVLALYAGEAGFFDDQEMKLLRELAGDIAFAMQHLEALGKVAYLAFHDPLTGLPNRTVLIDRLAQMLSAARRGNQLAGVMFFDVERFRLVNDTLGRSAGDEFLKQVAERFKAAIRAQDTVVRVGADVFAVAVSGITNVADAMHFFVDRLTRAFAPTIIVGGHELRAVLKAGIAMFPNDGDTAEILCRNAEAALNKAKEAGNRYVFYTPELNARVAESLALENRLRGALETGQFVLHYQPKVDTKTRALVGLEALIRWNDPDLGLVPPGKFIPLMEETGIILQAGRWALKRAVTDIQSWRAKGCAAPRVAVNVSPVQLRQPDFVKTVLGALKGFGEDAPTLDLEITESMVMQNLDATVQALQALRGAGVETSLDDFGTGYSSLAYVSRLPVVALKIDRSFVIEMASSRYARAIVETVISLAHSLGLKVIAEGVDAEEQATLLAALGCDQMQGYLISKPVPPEQIEAMLQTA